MALMPALGKINEISEPLLKYYFDGRISLIGLNKIFDSGRTRTYNLLLRRQAPYPLGHRAIYFRAKAKKYLFQNRSLQTVRFRNSQNERRRKKHEAKTKVVIFRPIFHRIY